jgi:hypothetical protein
LIEEMRRLGHTTMVSWAASAKKRLAEQMEQQDASACVRKKNADVVVCVWIGERDGAGLADGGEDVSALVAGRNWRQPARPFRAFGAGADGLWLRAFVCARRRTRAGALRLKLVQEKQRMMKDARLTDTGHKRPGMNKGLPLAEAQAKAAELDKQIHQLAMPTPSP